MTMSEGDTLEKTRTPHDHDVLCGRGGGTFKHVGNYTFRHLVQLNKALYVTCKKSDKIKISRGIVDAIRGQNPSGRFLEFNQAAGLWQDIGNRRAIEKTSQALREGQPGIRKNINALITTPSLSMPSSQAPQPLLPVTRNGTSETPSASSTLPPSIATCAGSASSEHTREVKPRVVKQDDNIGGRRPSLTTSSNHAAPRFDGVKSKSDSRLLSDFDRQMLRFGSTRTINDTHIVTSPENLVANSLVANLDPWKVHNESNHLSFGHHDDEMDLEEVNNLIYQTFANPERLPRQVNRNNLWNFANNSIREETHFSNFSAGDGIRHMQHFQNAEYNSIPQEQVRQNIAVYSAMRGPNDSMPNQEYMDRLICMTYAKETVSSPPIRAKSGIHNDNRRHTNNDGELKAFGSRAA